MTFMVLFKFKTVVILNSYSFTCDTLDWVSDSVSQILRHFLGTFFNGLTLASKIGSYDQRQNVDLS